MKITENYIGQSGVEYIFEYSDADSFADLDPAQCRQVYGVCFVGDQLVIGFGGQKKNWGLIGGTIEAGETFIETLKREIQEEANLEVLSQRPLGYQKVIDTRDSSFVYQLRYACAARPYGPFASDPAGGVNEVKFIDPKDYKQYFNWGQIGDRLIARACRFKEQKLI